MAELGVLKRIENLLIAQNEKLDTLNTSINSLELNVGSITVDNTGLEKIEKMKLFQKSSFLG